MKRKNEAKWYENKQYWAIKVQKDGERKQFTSSVKGRKGKIMAEAKADEWLESKTPSKVRFSAVWEGYMQSLAATTGRGNCEQKKSHGKIWLLPALKNRHFDTITEQDWQNIINAAFRKGLSRKSLENIRGTITGLCRFAKRSRIIKEVPSDLVIPKAAPKHEKVILQAKDIQTLFTVDTIDGKPAFFIHAWRFSVLTGVRPGECYGLKWSDLDGSTLHINRAFNALKEVTTGKNENAARSFVLSKRALAELEEQREMLKQRGIVSPWIFPTTRGVMPSQNAAYMQWNRYKQANGLPSCTPYGMRHTMVSASKKVPLEYLKQIVGHSLSMDTFGVYGHQMDGEKEAAAEMMDAVWDDLFTQFSPT